MITQNNKQQLNKLKNTIYNQLDGIIDRDYVLLDIPDHENIGDELIWEGEIEYLKRLRFKNLYTSNLVYFSKKKVSKDALILLHGGGNFGDIYKDLEGGWIQKATLHEFVISETVVPGMPDKIHSVIERTININNVASIDF